jgi:hypothetical protein
VSYTSMKEEPSSTPLTHATTGFEHILELRRAVAQLAEERLCAREVGLGRDPAYMRDLECESDDLEFAYQQALLFGLVQLRRELDGVRYG